MVIYMQGFDKEAQSESFHVIGAGQMAVEYKTFVTEWDFSLPALNVTKSRSLWILSCVIIQYI